MSFDFFKKKLNHFSIFATIITSEISYGIFRTTLAMPAINMQAAARQIRTIKAKNAIEKVLQKQLMKRNGGFCFSEQTSSDTTLMRSDLFKSSQIQQAKDLDALQHGFSSLFPNQTNFGNHIAESFANDRTLFNVLAIALTQSGKTGSMLSVIHNCVKQFNTPLDHCFVITGYSSKLWIEQTKERMPKQMHGNIFHRNTLKKFVQKCMHKKNVLIITDETHIASLHAQALHKAFKQLSIFDLKHLYDSDIKLVHFTATPDGIAANLSKWKFGHKTCIMTPPSTYISPFQLLDQNRVLQAKDLCGFDKDGTLKNADVYENIKEILIHIDLNSPKYHLIRTQNGKLHQQTIRNFEQVFADYDFDFRSETAIPSLDDLMGILPRKHTFIFIKEKLRCAKTVIKTHLGVLYERHVKIFNDSAVVQGFVGRLTGFHDNTSSVVFSNIPSIQKYRLFWQNHFSYNTSLYHEQQIPKWNSISTLRNPPHAKISAFFHF